MSRDRSLLKLWRARIRLPRRKPRKRSRQLELNFYGQNVVKASHGDPGDNPGAGGFGSQTTSQFGRGAFDAVEVQRL